MDDQNLQIVIGSLIVANLGTIGSILFFGGKLVWWFSKLDSRVERNEKDINAAHMMIREVKGQSNG